MKNTFCSFVKKKKSLKFAALQCRRFKSGLIGPVPKYASVADRERYKNKQKKT